YGVKEIQERHRHRFEFNNAYRLAFQQKGMVFSGLSPDRNLVEIAEIKDHPFMLGSQFHPEFLSRPNVPHPLFLGFIDAAIEHENEKPNTEHLSSYNGHPADTTEVRNT